MPTTLHHHEILAAAGSDPFYDRFPWFRLIGRYAGFLFIKNLMEFFPDCFVQYFVIVGWLTGRTSFFQITLSLQASKVFVR